MELSEIIAIGAGIAALVLAGLAYYRSGRPLNLQGVTETLADARTLSEELRQVAEIGVLAAQQLKERGDITTNDQAFQHAFAHVQKWYEHFGGQGDLDEEMIANLVEGVYYGIKKVNEAAGPRSDSELFNQWGSQEV